MSKDNENYELSAERLSEITERESLVEGQDIEGIFLLKNKTDAVIVLHEIILDWRDDPGYLNEIHVDLLFCLNLETTFRGANMLWFFRESCQEDNKQLIKSLIQVGALQSAQIIEKIVKLLPNDGNDIELIPKNGDFVLNNSDKDIQNQINTLSEEFAKSPDGLMNNLIYKYAEKHKDDLDI